MENLSKNVYLANSWEGFNRFLGQNAIWICLSLSAITLLIVGLIFLSGRKRKEVIPEKVISKSEYISALGGEENILSKELRGSRIVLVLKDYEKLDRQKIKEAGVDGFIMMSDRLTLVIKGSAELVYKTIFGE